MKLMNKVLSKDNLNQAYLQVVRNKGASGIDEMTVEEAKDYLKVHGEELINQILSRGYNPFPLEEWKYLNQMEELESSVFQQSSIE